MMLAEIRRKEFIQGFYMRGSSDHVMVYVIRRSWLSVKGPPLALRTMENHMDMK